MSVLQNSNAIPAAAATSVYDYEITKSIKFNGTSQALERTYTSAPSDADKKTISVWIKRSGSAGTNSEFGSTTNTKICSASNFQQLEFNTNNPTGYSDSFGYTLPGANGAAWSARRFRDPSAWLHLVWIYDSDQSTATDRIKVYFNGEQTPLSTDTDYWDINTSAQPGSGTDCGFGLNSTEFHVARYQYDDAGWFGGQMAEFIMIDGAASISDFGETHNGVWRPKDPSGLTFGTNGFWLKFTNASNPGEDFSGNDNDFTNIGSIPTSAITLDSPTNNFCTWNPLDMKNASLSGGNLDAEDDGTNYNQVRGTHSIGTSGKWYMELYKVNCGSTYAAWGVCDQNQKITASYTSPGYVGKAMVGAVWDFNQTDVYLSTTYSESSAGSDLGDTADVYTNTAQVIGMAIDLDNNKIFTHVNGSWDTACGDPDSSGSGFNASGLSSIENLVPVIFPNSANSPAYDLYLNAGQDSSFGGNKTSGSANGTDANDLGDFYYDPPSDYKAICSQNLSVNSNVDPASTSNDYPQKLFDSKLYTGSGGTQTISGVGFQPDFTWIKNYGANSTDNVLMDSTRGAYASNDYYYLRANTNAAQDHTTDFHNFASDGFIMGGTGTYFNASGNTFASWNWRANGGTTSSGSGDLTSTHQVDPSGGFSIVKAVGDGSGSGDKTVTHGMSAPPDCILAKNLDSTFNWDTYWSSGLTSGYGLRLNTNDNQLSGRWGTVNSSIFTCKYNYTWVGSDNFIYYCFRNIEGYIKVGTYTGNADNNGTFVYCGFRPAWMLLREVAADNWGIYDNKRDGQNNDDGYGNAVLYADENYDEENQASRAIDILSNGFKLRTSNATFNASGTYVFLAMAHNPFKYATAR
tara:strand:- start:12050 stop:14626 length:2577 start_codon:yes stop_codon:yes gene_type:complete